MSVLHVQKREGVRIVHLYEGLSIFKEVAVFYQPGSSQQLLCQWVHEIANWITYDSPDRATLDLITASEITDLTYLEGEELTNCIAANALIPSHIEQSEAYRGLGANSSMNILFPIKVEEEQWGYEILLRAGLPSMLAVGQGGWYPRTNPTSDIPVQIRSPQIGGTLYKLQEPGGKRLRSLAGPLRTITRTFSNTVTDAVGTHIETIALSPTLSTYAYVDDHEQLQVQQENGNFLPLRHVPSRIRSFYLREQSNGCKLHLEISWKRLQPDLVLLSITLQNQTVLPRDQQSNARNIILSALILPHLHISLHGAHADFPDQQYAQVKQKVLQLDEDQRREEAEHRLYQVRQSGCIATLHLKDNSRLSMTTFGIFDTPRETPCNGPTIEQVTQTIPEFLMHCPNHSSEIAQFVQQNWAIIRNILLAAGKAFNLKSFYQFQWDAIVTGLELEATGRERVVTIVRAPTGSGKTIVFMVNAAISSLCGKQRSTSLLLFPTRILNEDMFRRLTAFVYCMRENMPQQNITGGIFMGTSDPLYRLVLDPHEGEQLHHYGICPSCRISLLIAKQHGGETDTKLLPTCPTCGHRVNYMRNPREVSTYLPDIVIATPDKLFFEATVNGYELYQYGLFGAPVRACQICGRTRPDAGFKLQPDKETCNQIFKDSHCQGTFSSRAVSKPIRYMGFDEVHSLYGETATYLSVFLAAFEAMQRVLSGQRDAYIRYETATATVANETQLLEAITRRHASKHEIITIPSDEQMADYFVIQDDAIRHRVLLTMPSRVSSKDAFIRAVLNSYLHLRGAAPDLKGYLEKVSPQPQAWDFLLGYVFKKQDGFDLRRALGDFYRNRFGQSLNIEFLSGEAPKNQISRIIHKAVEGELDLLLANLVISLGIDIQDLNHMIMFGVPRGFTEYVQTAGRTGRGKMPGHVSIILLPNYPRDVYLYRHFHAVLSDVAGYYDVLPVKSTNLYCSEQIFGNVAKGLLSAFCLKKPEWTHRTGIQKVTKGIEDQLRGGMVRILCNDPTLQRDTQEIVLRKYRRLMQEIQTQTKYPFLAELMRLGDEDWLLYSLRGRANNSVRLSCSDEVLLEKMGMIAEMKETYTEQVMEETNGEI